MKRLLGLLRNGLFRRFFFSSLSAYVGINIGLVGISWFIVDYTNRNRILAIYTMITLITTIVVTFLSSGFIDKYNKSTTIRWCNGIQGVCLLGFVALIANNIYILESIFAMAIVNSICQSIYYIASNGVVQSTLNKDDLIFGTSILEICVQSGAIVASLVTGIIYNKLGFSIVLFIMGVSLIMSALLIKKSEKDDRKEEESLTNVKQIIEGGKYLKRNKVIILFGVMVFVPHMVTLLSNNVLPGYVSQFLKGNSVVYGIGDMMFGIGAFISGILISEVAANVKRGKLESLFFVISILSLGILVVNKGILSLYVIYFFFGLGNTSLKVILNTRLMEIVPENMYGRCYAFFKSISSLSQIFIVMMMGYLLDIISIVYGYLILAGIMLIGYLCIAVLNKKETFINR